MPYLSRRFPEAGFFALLLHSWRLQWNFGQCLIDRAMAGIRKNFSFGSSARNRLMTLAGEGRGLILLSAHIGCWQMAPYILAEHSGLPVTVLGHKDAQDIDLEPHEHMGRQAPYTFVGAEQGVQALLALMNCLHGGQLLCMMGDRSSGGKEPVVKAPFWGGPVDLPVLAYRLASATGATVIFAFALRTGPGRGKLCLGSDIRLPANLGNDSEAYEAFVRQFAQEMEDFTQNHPYQFFNFFNLWE
jgi:lauroyl/myristoyl acyltransferase